MSKLIKLALILAIAAVAMAATRLTPPGDRKAPAAAAASISPSELTRAVGALEETHIETFFAP
jgi:hypothetical protein